MMRWHADADRELTATTDEIRAIVESVIGPVPPRRRPNCTATVAPPELPGGAVATYGGNDDAAADQPASRH